MAGTNRPRWLIRFNNGNSMTKLVFWVLQLRSNRHHALTPAALNASAGGKHLSASYSLALKGVQKVNVTENSFADNAVDYELLAGVRTTRLDNAVNVRRNYWGTADLDTIRDKIFDFDDWNSYAVARFRPFYLEDVLLGFSRCCSAFFPFFLVARRFSMLLFLRQRRVGSVGRGARRRRRPPGRATLPRPGADSARRSVPRPRRPDRHARRHAHHPARYLSQTFDIIRLGDGQRHLLAYDPFPFSGL